MEQMESFVSPVENVLVGAVAEHAHEDWSGTMAVRSLANQVLDAVAQTEGAAASRDPNAVLGFAVGVADAVISEIIERVHDHPLKRDDQWRVAITNCIDARVAATRIYQASQ